MKFLQLQIAQSIIESAVAAYPDEWVGLLCSPIITDDKTFYSALVQRVIYSASSLHLTIARFII
jgi:hypothetical protein